MLRNYLYNNVKQITPPGIQALSQRQVVTEILNKAAYKNKHISFFSTDNKFTREEKNTPSFFQNIKTFISSPLKSIRNIFIPHRRIGLDESFGVAALIGKRSVEIIQQWEKEMSAEKNQGSPVTALLSKKHHSAGSSLKTKKCAVDDEKLDMVTAIPISEMTTKEVPYEKDNRPWKWDPMVKMYYKGISLAEIADARENLSKTKESSDLTRTTGATVIKETEAYTPESEPKLKLQRSTGFPRRVMFLDKSRERFIILDEVYKEEGNPISPQGRRK